MQIDQQLLGYVSGATFSELYRARINQPATTRHRFDVIEALVRGRSVIHVGCIDHVPLLADKIRAGTWFHGRLTRVASRCIGVDINAAGVDFARSDFDIDNVYVGDVAGDANLAPILEHTWDFMILGEVLEHVDNPVEFLQAIAENYGQRVGRIVISVPNAFRGGNILATFRNQEWINSDHRYWFTPYTLLKVAARAGLATEQLELCHFSTNSGLKRSLKNLALRRFPLLCEDLVAVCRPERPAAPYATASAASTSTVART